MFGLLGKLVGAVSDVLAPGGLCAESLNGMRSRSMGLWSGWVFIWNELRFTVDLYV